MIYCYCFCSSSRQVTTSVKYKQSYHAPIITSVSSYPPHPQTVESAAVPAASSATKELDDLMASLSDFKVLYFRWKSFYLFFVLKEIMQLFINKNIFFKHCIKVWDRTYTILSLNFVKTGYVKDASNHLTLNVKK